MNLIEIVGIIGALILIVAWIPELLETIKSKHAKLNKRFVGLLVIATTIILIYSWMKQDLVFILINGFLLIEISISAYYTLLKKRKQ